MATERSDFWIYGVERIRGFAIAFALVVGGVVLAVRGAGWGLVLVVIGLAFGGWVTRWPRNRQDSSG